MTATGTAQAVRLVDVLALGPFMMWAGSRLTVPWARPVMMLAGLATILYNGGTYLRVLDATGECGCIFRGDA